MKFASKLFVIFVACFLINACGSYSGAKLAKAESVPCPPAIVQNNTADKAKTPETVVNKDFTEDDNAGNYFLGKVFAKIPNKENRKAGQVIEASRLQGKIEVEDYYNDGNLSLKIMNYTKNGGMVGFSGDMPKKLNITHCGKPAVTKDILSLVDGNRMVVKGKFTIEGEGEGTHYVWQTLDLCQLD